MRLILSILFFILLTSCSTKYNGSHTDLYKFNEDVDYCLKISCDNKSQSVFMNISIISPLLAYGGGGGGGGGGGNAQDNNISYKTFNLCLKEKGYIKNENGMFVLPYLSCNKN